MKYQGPYRYPLFLTKKGIIRKEQNGQVVKFSKPVTNDKQPKIYIIQEENEIVYVGYASQPIGNRLSGGLKANGKNGYHGYGWKELDQVTLSVFVFEPFLGEKGDDSYDNHKLFVEAIEAELVYLVRQKTDAWPKYQHEIHFNNVRADEVRKITNEIYELLIVENIRVLWDEFEKAGNKTKHIK